LEQVGVPQDTNNSRNRGSQHCKTKTPRQHKASNTKATFNNNSSTKMDTGARVWLRSPLSQWGWLPARITHKEEITTRGKMTVRLTLVDDCGGRNGGNSEEFGDYFNQVPPFEVTISMDPASLKSAHHDDVKLRNVASREDSGGSSSGVLSRANDEPIGLVHDLIHLTHLHEPAILHSLRLRYDADVIYTSTGPILIAINPFKRMDELYGEQVMERYRITGEGGINRSVLVDLV
jgi:hypothetical protein